MVHPTTASQYLVQAERLHNLKDAQDDEEMGKLLLFAGVKALVEIKEELVRVRQALNNRPR